MTGAYLAPVMLFMRGFKYGNYILDRTEYILRPATRLRRSARFQAGNRKQASVELP